MLPLISNTMLIPNSFERLLVHYILSFHCYQRYSVFLDNVLDTSTYVSNYLHDIILMLAQYWSTRLQWTVEYLVC